MGSSLQSDATCGSGEMTWNLVRRRWKLNLSQSPSCILVRKGSYFSRLMVSVLSFILTLILSFKPAAADEYLPIPEYYSHYNNQKTLHSSYESAAQAAWEHFNIPSFWPGTIKLDWYTRDWFTDPNRSALCTTKMNPAAVGYFGTQPAIWVDILSSHLGSDGTIGCSNTFNDVIIYPTCPYGGSFYLGVCISAPACPLSQVRDPKTGACIVNPKNQGTPEACQNKGANPINFGVGNKFQHETDIASPVFPQPTFERVYNSTDHARGVVVGKHWQHSYERHITSFTNNSGTIIYYVFRPDGKFHTYTDVSGVLVGDADNEATLKNVVSGWEYLTKDGYIELYDLSGNLIAISDQKGNKQTLIYNDKTTKLERIEANTGQWLEIIYGTNYRIASVSDQIGRTWKYEYSSSDELGNDPDDFLKAVLYPDATPNDDTDNPRRQYHYNEPEHTSGADLPHALTGITDERGIRYATYEYYADGRAKASYHAGDVQRVDIAYDDTDGTRTVTNSKGVASTYHTDVQLGVALVTGIDGPGCSTCGSADTTYEYDPANNNLLAKVKQGLRTEYGNYDSKGQYGYKIEAVGTPEQRRTDYTYDPRFYNKRTSIIEPSVLAGSSKVTRYTYDDWGNRLTQTVTGFASDGTPVSRATTYAYEGPLHQLPVVDGPRTDVNDLVYYRYYPNDATVPVGSRGKLREMENANGILTRSNIQYTATGKVRSEDRPNGLHLGYGYYPGNDRLETLTETTANTTRTTRWTYLATGEVESITQAWGSVDAATLTFGYDDARRLTRITDGLGNHIEYTLDTEGNREAENTYDAGGVLRKQLTQTFDLYNRLDTTAQANETTDPGFAPDGTLDLATDGNGAITDYRYDDLKRLIQRVQDQNGSDPASANATTDYAYDSADRLISVTDPVNGNTSYRYDDLGNLLSQTSPDTGTTIFSYDAAGNLKIRTEAAGTSQEQTTVYAYDALDRLTGIDAPFTESDTHYQYDTCPGGQGRLCQINTASGTVQYAYDGFGQLIRHQAVRYRYDAAGRVQSLTYPSGAQLTYAYDAAGQLSQVDFSHGSFSRTLATNAGYYPFGPLASLTLGNGLQLTQVLDNAYRMREQRIPGVWERNYHNTADPDGYDANGNLRVRIQDGATETFRYDALNRLDVATGPFGNRDYDYDANGNRIGLTADAQVTDYAYTPATNRLSTLAGTPVILDAFGNTRSQGSWTYDYTPAHRLSSVSQGATLKAGFAYNGLGQRIRKTDEPSGESRVFLYDRAGRLLAEADGEGNLLTEYLYANGQLLALYRPDDNQDGTPNTDVPYAQRPLAEDKDGDGLRDVDEWLVYGTDARSSDTDGDGIPDGQEISQGTDPMLTSSYSGSGDLNGNGQLDVGDLLLVTQLALGTRTAANDPQYAARVILADQNQDGEINVADVLLLQRRLLSGERYPPQAALEPVAPGTAGGMERQTSFAALIDYLIHPAHAVPGDPGQLLYVHVDHLGTPVAMTDEQGVKVWSAVYDPFGKATPNEDPDGNGQAVTLNVRFPGQYYDSETGLHYNYFRYYDPSMGRYITADPIGLAGGPNTYAYVGGNPLRFIDLLGLVITGEWAGFSVSNVSGNYTGLTAHLERGPNGNDLVDRLGYFNFDISGTLGAKVKCKETECGEVKREWYLDGSVSVSDIDFRVPYDEPAIPIPGMGAVIMADKVLRTGQYINQWKSLIQTAGKALLNSPTLICQGSAFAK